MRFYSPLHNSEVHVIRTRFDCGGEPIYHAIVDVYGKEREFLFRPSELVRIKDDSDPDERPKIYNMIP